MPDKERLILTFARAIQGINEYIPGPNMGTDERCMACIKDEIGRAGKSVVDYPEGEKLKREAAIDIECDIWIPAARPDVVRANNVARLQTKLVVQGANIPFTTEAEKICHDRNILVVPDFIANAGGVICGAVEYRGGTQVLAFGTIEEKISHNTSLVLEKSASSGRLPRQVALEIAQKRIRSAMSYRHLISCS